MSDERAQTYLRLLAEQQARSSPRMSGSDVARGVEQVRWAGEILASAGVLAESDVHQVATELETTLLIRSDLERSRRARRAGWALNALTGQPAAERWWWGDATPTGSTPVGRTIRVAHQRAPIELHLMSLVRSPGGLVLAAAIRAHWPLDGSCADLEIAGAGPNLLPYDQLRAADDRGTGYRVTMSGEGGELTWQGAIGLHGTLGQQSTLPARARWLDLIADGTPLVRIELDPADIAPVAAGSAPAVAPGERLLTLMAERILASAWEEGGPEVDPRLGEAITVLTAAGALPASSPVPGWLAALCQRLGVAGPAMDEAGPGMDVAGPGMDEAGPGMDEAGPGIGAPPVADLPARWVAVLPGEPGPGPGPGSGHRPASAPEWFAPVGPAAADLDGARFTMAGLATAAGRSFLHVVATGTAPQPIHGTGIATGTGLSWWVRDGAGDWHLGVVSDPHALQPSLAMGFEAAPFRVRLTPPLLTRPDRIEVEVTGRTARARVVAPVGTDREMPDT